MRRIGVVLLGAAILIAMWPVVSQLTIQSYEGAPPVKAEYIVKVYKTPTCSCCGEYIKYLRDSGIRAEVYNIHDTELVNLKKKLGVPDALWSCHTSLVEGYFVEGHVPLEAIVNLLKERPNASGIALPGMPPGSPGMGGEKRGQYIIYIIYGDGKYGKYMSW